MINGGPMIRLEPDRNYVFEGDCAEVLPRLPDGAFQLIYIDPPFNSGRVQRRKTLKTTRIGVDATHRPESGSPDPAPGTAPADPASRPPDRAGGEGTSPTAHDTSQAGTRSAQHRTGFGGHRFRSEMVQEMGYLDAYDDYVDFIAPKLREARRLLADDGTLYVHLDQREVHYVKVLLDQIFGRECFLNEIVWAYDYGGRARDRWPSKHDTILVYVKTRGEHYFDQDKVERIPYMAPGLVPAEKRARGKLPTDVWWHTIVPTNSGEKTGYPNQKPAGILRRIISASSEPGARVLDFFAGSGTTGAVAAELERSFVLVDSNPAAIDVIGTRLSSASVAWSRGST